MEEIENIIINSDEFKGHLSNLVDEIDGKSITDIDATVGRFIDFLYKKTKNDKSVDEIFSVLEGEDHSEPIYINKINFLSICEHHLVPFFGTVDIGVLPDMKIAGLSKYTKLVEYFSNAFQIQERFTKQIGEKIHETLSPQGVFIRVKAQHICSLVDNGNYSESQFVTTHSTGVYSMDSSLREEAIKQFE